MSSVLFQMGGTSKRKKLTETRSLETRSLDQQAVDELIAEMNTDSTVSSYNLLSIPLIVNATVSSKGSDSTGKAAPLLAASLAPELIGLRDDDERFKADINTRPEDLSVRSDAYKLVRIEDFGAAMLRGACVSLSGYHNH